MKVAILSPVAWRTPPVHYGPWEQIASNIAEGLHARDIEITLFATEDSMTDGKLESTIQYPYEEDKSVDPKVVECLHISNLFEKANEFDIIHNNYDFLPLTYTPLVNTPMVTTIHGFSSPRILPVYQKFNDSHLNHYVSISNSDRSDKLNYISTVYNGINLENFEFDNSDGDYLLFFGRIHPDKGTKEAIEIAKQYGMKLIIAGIIQDTNYFNQSVKPHINNKDIIFVGEAEPITRNRLLGKAYALLHPINFEEPFGLSVIEAMACGTPVVAFNKGSMPELIKHGKNGFLVNNVKEAAEVLDSVNGINKSFCRKWVEENFSKEKMLDDYVKVYNQILTGSPYHAFPPWGHWEVLISEPNYKVKRITVTPGKRFSYQKHFKRNETWTAVSGIGLITLDGNQRKVAAGDVIHIPSKVSHRIQNHSTEPFVFIEVQQGEYLGEDDIVRLDDDYGRL